MFQFASCFEPIPRVFYTRKELLLESQGDHDIDYYVNSVSLHSLAPVWCAQISLSFIFYTLLFPPYSFGGGDYLRRGCISLAQQI